MKMFSLKALRVNAGLTQKEAAKHLGVSVRTLWQWENSKSLPNAAQINNICKLYDTNYEFIFFDLHNA